MNDNIKQLVDIDAPKPTRGIEEPVEKVEAPKMTADLEERQAEFEAALDDQREIDPQQTSDLAADAAPASASALPPTDAAASTADVSEDKTAKAVETEAAEERKRAALEDDDDEVDDDAAAAVAESGVTLETTPQDALKSAETNPNAGLTEAQQEAYETISDMLRTREATLTTSSDQDRVMISGTDQSGDPINIDMSLEAGGWTLEISADNPETAQAIADVVGRVETRITDLTKASVTSKVRSGDQVFDSSGGDLQTAAAEGSAPATSRPVTGASGASNA